jgi:hypothetical protein
MDPRLRVDDNFRLKLRVLAVVNKWVVPTALSNLYLSLYPGFLRATHVEFSIRGYSWIVPLSWDFYIFSLRRCEKWILN